VLSVPRGIRNQIPGIASRLIKSTRHARPSDVHHAREAFLHHVGGPRHPHAQICIASESHGFTAAGEYAAEVDAVGVDTTGEDVAGEDAAGVDAAE
jgi:hypothetical protein